MSHYLKTSIAKALSLVLAFTVAVGFMFVINTDRSFADDERNILTSANLIVEVPESGT